jgi:hypothetical protein
VPIGALAAPSQHRQQHLVHLVGTLPDLVTSAPAASLLLR